MKKILIIALLGMSLFANSQPRKFKPSKVDYGSYEQLVREVKEHRAARLIPLDTFIKMSLDTGVIILDTRTNIMYEKRHIKGAVHLNFSSFTEENLAKLIKTKDVKILIYCNNNIDGDEVYFPTKGKRPVNNNEKELMLALNVPTYISLYGYGYQNVYELSELVHISDDRLEFEGTASNDEKLLPRIILKTK